MEVNGKLQHSVKAKLTPHIPLYPLSIHTCFKTKKTHSFAWPQIHLMLLGVAGLETIEIVHGSLGSTSSKLLGPGSLLPLVVDLSYSSLASSNPTLLESLGDSIGFSTARHRDHEVSEVQTSDLCLKEGTDTKQRSAVS